MKNRRFLIIIGLCLLLSINFTVVYAQTPGPSAEPIRTILLAQSGYDRANALAISPDGKLLVVGSSLGIYFYNFQTGQEVRFIPTQTWVRSLVFSSTGESIVTGSYDNVIRLWRVSDGRLLREFKGHTAWVQAVALSPDGETLASASDDSTVRLWHVSDGFALKILKKNTTGIRALAFSPDSKMLATGGYDKVVRLLSVPDGTVLHIMEGHTDWVRCLAFSPNGETLASGGFDTIARQWRVIDGKLLSELKGHTSSVLSISYSPDGKSLATGSVDTTLRLWRASDGLPLRVLAGHKDFVFSVSFSPDGKTLASGAVNNTVLYWDVQGIKDLSPLNETPPTPSPGASKNCGACHHPLGYFTQPGGVSAPPRVLEVGCATCHQGGVVVMNWCPAFVRKFDGISVSVSPPISSDKVGVPQGTRELGVVISTVGNSEHYKSAPIITAIPIGGQVYYAGGSSADIKVILEIWTETNHVTTLTTYPQDDGNFSFNVNIGSDENELDVPIEQRTCIYCHSDNNIKQPYMPAGEVRLVVKAQAPDGIQASDERWIVVDRSQMIPASVLVVDEYSGKPVPGITVQARTRLYKWQARQFAAQSDINGRALLHIESLSQTPTIYKIQVDPTLVDGVMYEGVEPVEMTIHPEATATSEITLHVRVSNGKIDGNVNRIGVFPLPSALQVWAVRVSDGVSFKTTVTEHGAFVFDDLPVDKYLITTDLYALAFQGFYLKGKIIDLRVSSMAAVNLDLEHLKGQRLDGVVRDSNHQTIPFAWINVDKSDSSGEVIPESGNYVISDLPAGKLIVNVSAPGYYSQVHLFDPNSKQIPQVDFALVKRPETQSMSWGNGVVTIPPESMVKLDGEQIVFEQGWLWGSSSQAPTLLIQYGQMKIAISSGRFALISLPNQGAWLYLFEGDANIRSASFPAPVKINSGYMVALIDNSLPEPFQFNAIVGSALHGNNGVPITPIWQPDLKAKIFDGLTRLGISVAELITFITYAFITILVIALPLVGLYIYLGRRRKSGFL